MKKLLFTSTAVAILGCYFSNPISASRPDVEFDPTGHYTYIQKQETVVRYGGEEVDSKDTHVLFMHTLAKHDVKPSQIFADCHYPQAVIVQPYGDRRGMRINGGQTMVPLVVHFAPQYQQHLPFALQEKLKQAGIKDVRIMLCAQDFPWQDGTEIRLTPAYATAKQFPAARPFDLPQQVEAGVFDLGDGSISLAQQFVRSPISVHGDQYDITPSTQDGLRLKGVSSKGHSFYSYVSIGNQAFVTLHWLLSDKQHEELRNFLARDFHNARLNSDPDADQRFQLMLQAFNPKKIDETALQNLQKQYRDAQNEFWRTYPKPAQSSQPEVKVGSNEYYEIHRNRNAEIQRQFEAKHADLVQRMDELEATIRNQQNAAHNLERNFTLFIDVIDQLTRAEEFRGTNHVSHLAQLMNCYQPKVFFQKFPWLLQKFSEEEQQKHRNPAQKRLFMSIPVEEFRKKYDAKTILFRDVQVDKSPSRLCVAEGKDSSYADTTYQFDKDHVSQTLKLDLQYRHGKKGISFWLEADNRLLRDDDSNATAAKPNEDWQLTLGPVELEVPLRRTSVESVRYDLGKGGRYPFALAGGFSGPEGQHIWTDGNRAVVKLPVIADSYRVKSMLFRDTAAYGIQDVTVTLDGKTKGRYHYDKGTNHTIEVPLNHDASGHAEIAFNISNPHAPSAADPRLLGMKFGLVDVVYFNDPTLGALYDDKLTADSKPAYDDKVTGDTPPAPAASSSSSSLDKPQLPEQESFRFFAKGDMHAVPEHALTGFSVAEDGHRWTDGNTASIKFPSSFDGRRIKSVIFTDLGSNDQQSLTLKVNGIQFGNEILFNADNPSHSIEVPLPSDATGEALITFDIPFAFAPGNGEDRSLGISFKTLEVKFQ
jgi:hypothetical protein